VPVSKNRPTPIRSKGKEEKYGNWKKRKIYRGMEGVQWAEMRRVRWMCDIELQDRVPSKGLRKRD